MNKRALGAALGMILLAGISSAGHNAGVALPPPAAATAPAALPNVVVIMADDQRHDTLTSAATARALPTLTAEVMAKGVHFTQAVTSNPWCCPGRAAFFTGQYSHKNNVYTNTAPYGGWHAFRGDAENRSLPVWLTAAGYRTGGFGKLFNGYRTGRVKGWSDYAWFAGQEGNEGGAYENYSLVTPAGTASYGSVRANPDNYSTDVITRRSLDFIRSTPSRQPLFLYAAYFGPHAPALAAPRHGKALGRERFTAPPNQCERDLSDKPAWVRALATKGCPSGDGAFTSAMRKQLRPLMSMDDGLADILDALRDTGRLANTMIVWVGDNGYSRGEHRWQSKQAPYEEDIRIPLAIRYDPWTRGGGAANDSLVSMIDLAPTIVAAAGLATPADVEGLSLRPLLTRESAALRDEVLVEHRQGGGRGDPVPTYCALRTTTHTYVAYTTGERELYDLVADPYQLTSRHDDPALAGTRRDLDRRLRALCLPTPPGFRW